MLPSLQEKISRLPEVRASGNDESGLLRTSTSVLSSIIGFLRVLSCVASRTRPRVAQNQDGIRQYDAESHGRG